MPQSRLLTEYTVNWRLDPRVDNKNWHGTITVSAPTPEQAEQTAITAIWRRGFIHRNVNDIQILNVQPTNGGSR